VVFRLTPTKQGKWKESILYSFTGGKDGGSPQAGLIFDADGNLYGTAFEGGDINCGFWTPGCGVVFELTPTSRGEWKESVLHTFEGADGKNPAAGLIFDSAGSIYGTTVGGGSGNCFYGGCGGVFKLTPRRCGKWKETVLFKFTGGNDGGQPSASLTPDAKGNLYGTTGEGGESNAGVVFELARSCQGNWKEKVLHSFSGTDGAVPFAGVMLAPSGRLYGTTLFGGNCGSGCGVAFELRPEGRGKWTETTIYKFCSAYDCADGGTLYAGLTPDAEGNLYGAAFLGGAYGYGAIFELTLGGGKWTETVLKSFPFDYPFYPFCQDGASPAAGVIFDGAGNLYGTTFAGGYSCGDAGVAFELTPQSIAAASSD